MAIMEEVEVVHLSIKVLLEGVIFISLQEAVVAVDTTHQMVNPVKPVRMGPTIVIIAVREAAPVGMAAKVPVAAAVPAGRVTEVGMDMVSDGPVEVKAEAQEVLEAVEREPVETMAVVVLAVIQVEQAGVTEVMVMVVVAEARIIPVKIRKTRGEQTPVTVK
jgi:hypothetical protein